LPEQLLAVLPRKPKRSPIGQAKARHHFRQNNRGPSCQGARTIASVRELSPTKVIERKLLYENAKKLFKL
jgi:hypothetical protein